MVVVNVNDLLVVKPVGPVAVNIALVDATMVPVGIVMTPVDTET